MDYEDDVIDLTWMTKEELNEYIDENAEAI